jgi:hypothetical protein
MPRSRAWNQAGLCCGHPMASVSLNLGVELTGNAARVAVQGTESMCFLKAVPSLIVKMKPAFAFLSVGAIVETTALI